MTRWAFLLIAATAALGTRQTSAADADDYLRYRWYRIELLIFEQSTAVARREAFSRDGVAARSRMLEAVRYPRQAFALAEDSPPEIATQGGGDGERILPFGATPDVADRLPVVISNLVPPVWFAGECVTEFWAPAVEGWIRPVEMPPPPLPDPCLPSDGWQVERLGMEWAMDPGALGPMQSTSETASGASDDPAPETPTDPREIALEDLLRAFAEYEDALLSMSYVWQRSTPRFATERANLERGYRIIAAGSWQQPVPPREAPQPLLVQLGTMDGNRRFPLEGWFSVTLGRYIHFQAVLEHSLADGGIALFSERRRMRSDEPHYLDHPALGILARVDPVAVPGALLRLVEELDE